MTNVAVLLVALTCRWPTAAMLIPRRHVSNNGLKDAITIIIAIIGCNGNDAWNTKRERKKEL